MDFMRFVLNILAFSAITACGVHSTESFGEQKTGGVTRVEKSADPLDQASEAIQADQAEKLQKLIEVGLSVDTELKNGRTLLIEAVAWSRVELVKLLLQWGARLELKDKEGRTALDHAEGKPALLRLLKPQTQQERQLLFRAVIENRFNDVKSLLQQGIDPNLFSDNGETPLTLAVTSNFENVVRVLLQQSKTDVNLQNKAGQSPLAIARTLNLKRIEDLLRRRGAKL